MTRIHNHNCDQCDTKFRTKEMLSNHIAECHKNSTEKAPNKTVLYMCNVCEQTFSNIKSLEDHLTKNKCKEIKCNKCSKLVLTKNDLINHLKKDHGQPPLIQIDDHIYKCNVCNKTFESKNELKNHLTENICPHPPTSTVEHNGNASNNNNNNQLNNHMYRLRECRNGMECRFLKNNKCKFYHAVAEQPANDNVQWQQVNNQRRQNSRHSSHHVQQTRVSSVGVQWCRYGNRCNRGRFCPFRHYDLDFPPLSVRSRQ